MFTFPSLPSLSFLPSFFFFRSSLFLQVAQLIQDYEEPADVNKQLEKMGKNIGERLIDDFLAHSGIGKCANFKETADAIAKVGFKLFLGECYVVPEPPKSHPRIRVQPPPTLATCYPRRPFSLFANYIVLFYFVFPCFLPSLTRPKSKHQNQPQKSTLTNAGITPIVANW